MRQFAFFLPQFHEIKENNEWWGKGFTEWTNVKKALPMFQNHGQPKLPLNENYYCLLERDTVEWQTSLMNQYHVDGLIYYHYYFEGIKLLEKPAENLLEWKDIEQPFFFCWANHTWYRSWNGSKEVLLEQTYGGRESWEKHFNYLLPFFKDRRYEKKNNKPLFMIFSSSFSERKEMFSYFDERCKESGFNGICLIETYDGANYPKGLISFEQNLCAASDHIFLRQPTVAARIYYRATRLTFCWFMRKIKMQLRRFGCKRCIEILTADKLYDFIPDPVPFPQKCIHGTFFEWDNTPRHKYRGFIIRPVDRERYFRFMDKIKNDEYVFINAWNEWAEGMMLEPTVENGYQYLEWIKEWVEREKPV